MGKPAETSRTTGVLKSLTAGERLWLLGILLVGLALRVTGIGWGAAAGDA